MAAVIAVSSVAAPGAAVAADADDLLGWLDDDAPVVITVRPAALERVSRLATDWFGSDLPALSDGVRDLGADLSAVVGFDAMAVDAWRAAGFDPDSPIAISVGAIDDIGTRGVFDDLFAAKDWNDRTLRKVRKVYWRSRAVAKVRDADAAAATVARAAAALPRLHAVTKANARKVSMTLGGSARKAKPVYDRLRKRKILAVGWIDGIDAVVAVHIDRKRKVAVVDVVGSFAGVPTVWPRDSRKVIALIDRHPGNSRLRARIKAGAGLDVLDADAAMWIQPGAFLDAAKAMGRHRALGAVALSGGSKRQRKQLHAAATAEIERCNELRPLVGKGPFVDLALAFDLSRTEATWRARWGLRAKYALAAALVPDDDGLLSAAGAKDAVVAGAVHLGGLDALRGLPRAPALASGQALAEAVYDCGAGGGFIASVFGWPQLIGLALDEASAEPALAAVIGGVRNGAFAIRRLAADDELDAVVSVSMTEGAGSKLRTLLSAWLGSAATRSVRKRTVTEWKLDTARAFAWAMAKDLTAVGFATRDGGVPWMVRASAASKRASGAAIAWIAVDAPELLDQLARLEPGASDSLRAMGRHVGALRGAVRVDGGALESRVSLELR